MAKSYGSRSAGKPPAVEVEIVDERLYDAFGKPLPPGKQPDKFPFKIYTKTRPRRFIGQGASLEDARELALARGFTP